MVWSLCIQVKFPSFWLLLHLCRKPFKFITAVSNLVSSLRLSWAALCTDHSRGIYIFSLDLTALCANGWWCPRPRESLVLSCLQRCHCLWSLFWSMKNKLGQSGGFFFFLFFLFLLHLWPTVKLEMGYKAEKNSSPSISSRAAFCAFLIRLLF